MHHMLIIVGSTRSAKVEAARAAIDLIARVDERFAHATLQTVDVTDVAPTMPMTDSAIRRRNAPTSRLVLRAALIRCRAAMAATR